MNVDVLDQDACEKLSKWFNDRWDDKWCLDISAELAEIIDKAGPGKCSRRRITFILRWHITFLKRPEPVSEFHVPADFGNRLFEFQTAAVKIAAHHLNKRGGVLIGDVVGLGKTLVATALARIFQDDQSLETLIICPKNLVKMWQSYVDKYRLIAKVLSLSQVIGELPKLRRYRVVVIDESHNLRNQDGKRYRSIMEYVQENESKCILLSATPYNKTYLDLSSQLRLFVPPDEDLGVRPERLIKQYGETEFLRAFQAQPRTLAAFEKSEHADDWRELMRLYLVRRTRSFIKDNYAHLDPANGRNYLTLADGTRSYFPEREPKTVKFNISENDPSDQYAKMYHKDVVQVINTLKLPRYGLGNYQKATSDQPPTRLEDESLADLGRAGNRLIGFCRTNLFKRLESSGKAFLMSVERHILRNYIFLYAIENGLPLPIGAQDSDLLDTRFNDEDRVTSSREDENGNGEESAATVDSFTDQAFRKAAAQVYTQYHSEFKRRFRWLRSSLFDESLAEHLQEDSFALFTILDKFGEWDPAKDAKLDALHKLLTQTHSNDKVLVFSQFADTVSYLNHELQLRGLRQDRGSYRRIFGPDHASVALCSGGQSEDSVLSRRTSSPDYN